MSLVTLDATTVLLQWAVGGLLGCWVTTRRREVGLGYGWLLRSTFLALSVGSLVIALGSDETGSAVFVRDLAGLIFSVSVLAGLVSSIARRRAGVSGRLDEHDRRSERVAEMTGIERAANDASATTGREFAPLLDLVTLVPGAVAVVAAGVAAGGNDAVAVARTVVGAVFLGLVTDAMLLGHWYLVQPGLPRRLLDEVIRLFLWVWPVEVVVMLLPTGMFSVFSGAVDDGWGGQLGWFWAACAVTTGVLTVVTQRALRERAYSAVMAATGLMYLAILTAFGTDLVARAVLAG